MRNLILIFLLTFSFNSYSETWEEGWQKICNDSLQILKNIGFNFSSYDSLDPVQINNGVLCGSADGYAIKIKPNPILRIYFTGAFGMGYCVHSSGKYEKLPEKDC